MWKMCCENTAGVKHWVLLQGHHVAFHHHESFGEHGEQQEGASFARGEAWDGWNEGWRSAPKKRGRFAVCVVFFCALIVGVLLKKTHGCVGFVPVCKRGDFE